MTLEDNHEYKCTECRHKGDCVRVSAFLMANVFPYSDGCESFEKESEGARTNGELISREALKEDFKSRLAACNEWIEKAKDKETKIRASAVKAFITEIVMTIDNAPTVEPERPQGEWINRETGGTLFPFWERYECNQCHKFNYYSNFCPNCGAEMKGGAE